VSATSDLPDLIARGVASGEAASKLAPARVGEGDRKNELLLFIKPEAFVDKSPAHTREIVNLILERLRHFEVQVDGVATVTGGFLAKNAIMSRHYGFINVLSNTASSFVGDKERGEIEKALGQPVAGKKILGGHEFLKQYPNMNSGDLDKLWFEDRSAKVRSGFYVRPSKVGSDDVILVNGFHPEQLAHFERPERRIALFLLHSNTQWGTLRNEMVGATFPDRAAAGSIRATLHANPAQYGFKTVGIENNTVHLSAGPFEGLSEIVNFFGPIEGLDPAARPPLALKRMLAAGISHADAMRVTQNPSVTTEKGTTDLYGATEDIDTDQAVAFWKGQLAKSS
jgi:hypothetical protein